MTPRIAMFATVGALGFMLQIGVLAGLTALADWPYAPATAVAVEAAVLHNFRWHERWTWSDRRLSGSRWPGRLLKYHMTTAATSLAGNLILTAAFAELAGAPVVAANVAAVTVMGAANFMVTDRWVFARRAVAPLVLMALWPATAVAAEAPARTIAAWDQFVTNAETELHQCRCEVGRPEGTSFDVPGGTIHRWRGSTFVPGTTVDEVLRALMDPGTPPPQEDVLESSVLSRYGDTIAVYLKLTRRTIVTVTYHTEHKVTFLRHSPTLATSRSIATRVEEVGGGNRGFLWRLNSYWRYSQERGGVRIDLESLSLSRGIPAVIKPAAAPLIRRVGRESIVRTLDSVRRFLQPG